MNVIFDMDGLMFDTERVFVEAWDYAGEKIGIGKAGYMVLKTLGMNISMLIWKRLRMLLKAMYLQCRSMSKQKNRF